jgi:hypothetical protein
MSTENHSNVDDLKARHPPARGQDCQEPLKLRTNGPLATHGARRITAADPHRRLRSDGNIAAKQGHWAAATPLILILAGVSDESRPQGTANTRGHASKPQKVMVGRVTAARSNSPTPASDGLQQHASARLERLTQLLFRACRSDPGIPRTSASTRLLAESQQAPRGVAATSRSSPKTERGRLAARDGGRC